MTIDFSKIVYCEKEGCKHMAFRKGMCRSHYYKDYYEQTKARRPGRPPKVTECTVCGDVNTIARSLCWKHYQKWRRTEGNGYPKPVPPCEERRKHVYTKAGVCLRCGWCKPTALRAPIAP